MRARFDSSRLARKTTAREHTKLKGELRIRRPARNSARTPRGRTTLLASIWRGLLGFAGLASHIRPLLTPNPSCNVPGVKILPTTRDTTACPATAWVNEPLTKHRV